MNLSQPSTSSVLGIDVENVSITYANGHKAMQSATFQVPIGAIAALVGINGSGKSTLFKAIMGLVRPQSGSVHILGMPVRRALRKNLIAYVPQSEEVDWNFPVLVEDVVMMGRYGRMGALRRPKELDRNIVSSALDKVNLLDLRKRQIGELSGGQKKRVFLARALAQEAQVILLDEPFTGVDVKTEDAIIALLKRLRDDGKVMLVSTHNLGSVPEFCDKTILVRGTVLAYGETDEIFTHANLERAFGGVLRHLSLAYGDTRVGVMTDDERPLILSDGKVSPQHNRDATSNSTVEAH